MNGMLAKNRDVELSELRDEVTRLSAEIERLLVRDDGLSVARFVVSDYESGLPVARSTLDAAQRALGLPAADDGYDDGVGLLIGQ